MNTKLLEWKENKSGCFSGALGFRYQILEWQINRMPTYIASFHTDLYGSGKLQEDVTVERCKEACQRHHEAILAEVAKSMPKWIPVSEGLPENQKAVLCFGKWHWQKASDESYVFHGFYCNGVWWPDREYEDNMIVTHWQPLPPAPSTKK